MKKTRVMLVDDSVVVRRLVSDAIQKSWDCELVFAAKSGTEALAQLRTTKTDLILLDLEMPGLDGIETVHAIRERDTSTPILMFSAITTNGAVATLDSLAAGANDYVAKPTKMKNREEVASWLERELLPRIRQFGDEIRRRAKPHRDSPSDVPKLRKSPSLDRIVRPDIVGIGASTGGPQALTEVLSRLPADFPVPIVVAQHMPPVFTQLLAERLNDQCELEVREAIDNEPLRAGQVWLAPGGLHLSVTCFGEQMQTRLSEEPKDSFCRPSVDVLFRSMAESFGERALGVVLTGMGSDGLAGALAIKHQFGSVLVQDQASCKVWGMPRVVEEAGISDAAVPLSSLALEIINRVLQSATPHSAQA